MKNMFETLSKSVTVPVLICQITHTPTLIDLLLTQSLYKLVSNFFFESFNFLRKKYHKEKSTEGSHHLLQHQPETIFSHCISEFENLK